MLYLSPPPTPPGTHASPLFIALQREWRNNLQIFNGYFSAMSKVGTSAADLKSRRTFKGTLPKCQLYLRLRYGSVQGEKTSLSLGGFPVGSKREVTGMKTNVR